jgi:hypothetical protein
MLQCRKIPISVLKCFRFTSNNKPPFQSNHAILKHNLSKGPLTCDNGPKNSSALLTVYNSRNYSVAAEPQAHGEDIASLGQSLKEINDKVNTRTANELPVNLEKVEILCDRCGQMHNIPTEFLQIYHVKVKGLPANKKALLNGIAASPKLNITRMHMHTARETQIDKNISKSDNWMNVNYADTELKALQSLRNAEPIAKSSSDNRKAINKRKRAICATLAPTRSKKGFSRTCQVIVNKIFKRSSKIKGCDSKSKFISNLPAVTNNGAKSKDLQQEDKENHNTYEAFTNMLSEYILGFDINALNANKTNLTLSMNSSEFDSTLKESAPMNTQSSINQFGIQNDCYMASENSDLKNTTISVPISFTFGISSKNAIERNQNNTNESFNNDESNLKDFRYETADEIFCRNSKHERNDLKNAVMNVALNMHSPALMQQSERGAHTDCGPNKGIISEKQGCQLDINFDNSNSAAMKYDIIRQQIDRLLLTLEKLDKSIDISRAKIARSKIGLTEQEANIKQKRASFEGTYRYSSSSSSGGDKEKFDPCADKDKGKPKCEEKCPPKPKKKDPPPKKDPCKKPPSGDCKPEPPCPPPKKEDPCKKKEPPCPPPKKKPPCPKKEPCPKPCPPPPKPRKEPPKKPPPCPKELPPCPKKEPKPCPKKEPPCPKKEPPCPPPPPPPPPCPPPPCPKKEPPCPPPPPPCPKKEPPPCPKKEPPPCPPPCCPPCPPCPDCPVPKKDPVCPKEEPIPPCPKNEPKCPPPCPPPPCCPKKEPPCTTCPKKCFSSLLSEDKSELNKDFLFEAQTIATLGTNFGSEGGNCRWCSNKKINGTLSELANLAISRTIGSKSGIKQCQPKSDYSKPLAVAEETFIPSVAFNFSRALFRIPIDLEQLTNVN